MPNIMLTYRCNLKCPYCFANEFVNKQYTDITIDDFNKAVEFVTRINTAHIGLIGGEPTIHPQFAEIVKSLLDNEKVEYITVYSNGLYLDKYFDLLINPKVHILVNCNSPEDIGEQNFEKLKSNLDVIFKEESFRNNINLGCNLYDQNKDYTFIRELLVRYNLHRLRISLTVPDFSSCANIDILEHFKSKKDFILSFLRSMDQIQVLPYYDCNKPPYCIWTDEEKEWLEAYVKKYPIKDSNLIGNCSQCYPVIDILPNLNAVRCFGMSDFMKVNIEDFRDVGDLASYFINCIDTNAYKISGGTSCNTCYEKSIRHCTAGCIGFKADSIRKANAFFDSMNESDS